MELPKSLKYTKDHEWIKIEGNLLTIGITDYAQKELGDIVYVEVETEGELLDKEDSFGTVEAVKTVSDLFMPVSGKVTVFNEALEDSPQLINTDAYGDGWMIKLEATDVSEFDDLLDADSYAELIGTH